MEATKVGGNDLQAFDYARLVNIVGVGLAIPSADHLLGSALTYVGGPAEGPSAKSSDDYLSLSYVADNLEQLAVDNRHVQWILVKKAKVVAAGNDLGVLLHDVAQRGIESPLIIDISAHASARRTAYGAWLSSDSI